MKIGEAGEAFFVFETEADVPEDLITSPILEATKIGETNTHIKAGKFGAKESTEEPDTFDLDAEPTKFANDPENKPTEGGDALNTENSQSQQSGQPEGSSLQEPVGPSNYLDVGKNFGKAVVQAVVETEREIQEHLMDRADAARYLATNARLARKSTGDDILPSLDSEAARPADVVYTDGTL
jgi:phosphatidate phosphatase LPIN